MKKTFRLLALLGALFCCGTPAQDAPTYTWNSSDANATGCILYDVVDGSGSAGTFGSVNGTLLVDYVAGNPTLATVPTSVTVMTADGTVVPTHLPTQYDPTHDASWPWKGATAIAQYMYALNCFDGTNACQPYAYWENLGLGSSPAELWAQNGPGTSGTAGYTWVSVVYIPNDWGFVARVGDTNEFAPNTFYGPEVKNTNTGAVTFKTAAGGSSSPSWTYPSGTWLIMVAVVDNVSATGKVYANFTSGGGQTSVSSGLNLIANVSSINANKTWQAAFDSILPTGSSDTSHTILDFFGGKLALFAIYNYQMTAAEANHLALNPFSPLTSPLPSFPRGRGNFARGRGLASFDTKKKTYAHAI